jgi:hypothetical protein
MRVRLKKLIHIRPRNLSLSSGAPTQKKLVRDKHVPTKSADLRFAFARQVESGRVCECARVYVYMCCYDVDSAVMSRKFS